ncbi:MAG TPA: glycosyltransferase family 39 protein [Vicinamibacterales bacterium]|nr:glycosyltransferase family 39 protein [Vicinamibacterales bacterium]
MARKRPRARPPARPPGVALGNNRPGFAPSRPARLALFLAVTVAIKLVAVVQLKDHVLLQVNATGDSAAYFGLAQRVVSGDLGLGPGLYYVSPLYIYFLAFVTWIGTSIDGARIMQILLGTGTIALVFATAREWFGERTAWIAASLAALTGLFTFYELLILQASLDPFLTAAVLWLLAMALRRPQAHWPLFAGAVCGLFMLNRPNVLVAVVGLVLVLAIAQRWRTALLLAAGVLIALLPVGIRNAVVAHEASLLPSHGGLNFYIGNNADANGLFRMVPGVSPTIEGQARDTRRVAEAALKRSLTDGEVSSYWSGLAITWIREHPIAWLRLFAIKAGYVFNAQHIPLPLSYPFFAYDARSMLRFLFVGPWCLIPLGLVGLIGSFWLVEPRPGRDYLIWVAFVPLYALSVALFFTSERYRLPLLVPFAIGAGAAVDQMLRLIAVRHFRALGIMSSAVVVLIVACNWPLNMIDGDGRGEERVHMAENLARTGDATGALAWLARALEVYPYTSLAHYRVGVQFANSGQPPQAVAELTEALRLDPSAPALELALGQALTANGQPREAIPHLRAAFDSSANTFVAGAELAAALNASGEKAAATQVLQQVSTQPSPGADTSMMLGEVAADMNAFDLAQRFFDQATAAQPDSMFFHDRSGRNQLSRQRFDDAVREFAAAARIAPQSVDELTRLAFAEFHAGRIADARTHVTAALALDPRNATALEVEKLIRH